MRAPVKFAVAVGALGMVSAGACAEPVVIVNHNPATYYAFAAGSNEPPWEPRHPHLRLVERPIGELIAAKLGFARGNAELFRYQLEDAPSKSTRLDGMIEGAGIKLKISW